jgi:general secretion pathway protein E
MAQRLVRVLCPHCKESYRPKADDLPPGFPRDSLASDAVLYRAVGCRQCLQVGYRGRLGLFELLPSTDEVRRLAHDRVSSWTIQQAAIRQGMRTLRDDGWRKVIAGHTTVDEVLRVTKANVER